MGCQEDGWMCVKSRGWISGKREGSMYVYVYVYCQGICYKKKRVCYK